jgi:hypothetical protein
MLLGAIVMLAAPDIRLDLNRGAERYRDRIDAAIKESITAYEQWLGPLTRKPIATTAPNLPWRSPHPFMEVEAHVAYAIALRYLGRGDSGDTTVARSLSWYLQSRVVERLFNVQFGALAHSTDGARFFGGYIPWAQPSLRLSRWTAGLALDGVHRLPPSVDAETQRGALAFGSLERYLGWPALQGALQTLATTATDAPLTLDRVTDVVSAASGQDLRWFFDQAFDPAVTFDYAIESLRTSPGSCAGTSCYRSEVTATRNGTGQFTGSSRPPVGEYESGQAMTLRVIFEDGQESTARWDGRATRRIFAFESLAPAAAVRLDPKGVLLLEATPLDYVHASSPRSNMPVAKWVARWLVWLQDAMLTGSALL